MKYTKIGLVLSVLFIIFLLSFGPNFSSAQTSGPVQLSVDSASVAPGSSVDLNIYIDPDNSAQKPASVQWDFSYSPNNIVSIVWKTDGGATTGAGKTGSCSAVSAGLFRCLILGFNTNIIAKGTLGTVTLTLANQTSATSIPINLSNLSASNANGVSIPITATGGTITVTSSGGGNTNPLTATCSPSATTSFIGNSITWSAFPAGGTGAYQYVWSGSENLSGNNSFASISYTTEGTKNASVQVISGAEQITTPCASTVAVSRPPTIGWCSVDAGSFFNNEYNINWNSSFSSPVVNTTSYSWSGTDGLSSANPFVSKKYTTAGLKTGNVNIQSGQQTLPLSCSANVSNILPSGSSMPLGGGCFPSVSNLNVTWNATANGGSSQTTTYQWSGSDGLATTSPQAKITYTTEGIKTASVIINNGNESIVLTCQAKVAANAGGSGCFIATAVFDTEMEPEVMVLRHFRDESLLTNPAGKVLVDVYYKVSPPIADFIRESESLKTVVRAGLEPIIFGLEKVGY